jgi:hypothetical protein
MSKARKLAELVDGTADKLIGYDSNGDVAEKTPLVSSVNGATGAVTVSVPVSSVNGSTGAVTVPVHDDLAPKLRSARNDIATLALNSAVADNKAAYNLTNTFIDQFEDSSGILTNTDVDRHASEYVSSIGTSVSSTEISYAGGTANSTNNAGAAYVASKAFDNNTSSEFADDGAGTFPQYIRMDFGSGNDPRILKYSILSYTSSNPRSWEFKGSPNADLSGGVILETVSGHNWPSTTYTSGTLSNENTYRYYGLIIYSRNGSSYVYIKELDMFGAISSANATGTLISNTQTANAAQTKVSGVLLYKNNAGTATLNTDFKLYFSCDNGTNWTQSTMTSGGTFSTGVLIAKGAEVTCTSGTSIKYKVEWANQAADTKETQLHGIGVNY